MRLICPNCGAQYEVDSSMIPDEGRDVQCSSCGQTWFQPPEGAPLELTPAQAAAPGPGPETQPPAAEAAKAAEPATADAPGTHDSEPDDFDEDEDEDDGDTPVAEIEDDPDVGPIASDDRDDGADDDSEDAADEDDAPSADLPAKPSQKLDENILGMLREEAEREASARREEAAAGLETQPDLGLSEEDGAARSGVSAHLARMRKRATDAEPEDDVEPGPAARSELLPDIDEINSSLRPASEHPETTEVQDPMLVEARERRGFRSGFTIMIVIAAILVLAYVFAPQIVQQVPAAEPVIILYVDGANSVRDMIDGLLQGATGDRTGQ